MRSMDGASSIFVRPCKLKETLRLRPLRRPEATKKNWIASAQERLAMTEIEFQLVIPGERLQAARSGIHNHHREYGFRAHR